MSKRAISGVDDPAMRSVQAIKRPRTMRRVAFVPIGNDNLSPMEDTLNGIFIWTETAYTAPGFMDIFLAELRDLEHLEDEDLESLPMHYIHYMANKWSGDSPPRAMSRELRNMKAHEYGDWNPLPLDTTAGRFGFMLPDMPPEVYFYSTDIGEHGFEDADDDTLLKEGKMIRPRPGNTLKGKR